MLFFSLRIEPQTISKTYQFVLSLDQGRFRMLQSCEDSDIRYEICLLINYLFTVPMERLRSFRAVRGGDGSDVLFLCEYCGTSLNNDFLLKISDDKSN